MVSNRVWICNTPRNLMEIEDEIKHDWYYSVIVLRILKDEDKQN